MRCLEVLLALTSLSSCIFAQQMSLHHPSSSPSFIKSSVFGGQRKFGAQAIIQDPIPPSYQLRSVGDDLPVSGLDTFAHLNWTNCFAPENNGTFDIAIVGAPFDLGVSYRPGARFGPTGARMGARRINPSWGWDMDHGVNPFRDWATVTDCGDIQNTPFDKLQALQELESGWNAINAQSPKNTTAMDAVRIISIGGDHTISGFAHRYLLLLKAKCSVPALPILRALHSTWGRVAVLHFDSHLDTWDPKQLGGGLTKYSEINHGTMLHIAHEEGLLSNHSNMHLGSRCALSNKHFDLDNDLRCGFSYIRARELDKLGINRVVEKIRKTIGDEFVYLSVDIDVLDPAFAPATGTIEPGGWTTRELLQILSGLSEAGLKIIGADVVEFTPIYDNAAETTGIAVGEIIYEILQWMVRVPVRKP